MCAVEFNYQTYFTKEQWEALPKDVQEKCKSTPIFAETVKSSIAAGTNPAEISTKLAGSKTKNDAMMGLEIERSTANQSNSIDALKPRVDLSAMDSRSARKASKEQWEEYFTARYNNNPEEAKRDIVRVLYQKDVQKTALVLEKIQKDNPILINSKYFAEGHATDDEKAQYDQEVARLTQYYSKKENLEAAKDEYNNEFTLSRNKKNRVGTGETLTPTQIKELAERKAMMDFKIGPERITMMAENAVLGQHFNKAMLINFEYRDKIEKAKAEAETPESKQMKKEFALSDIEMQKKIEKAMEDAQTPESKKLKEDAIEADRNARIEIRKARLMGDDKLADSLEQKRLEAKTKAESDIAAALDPDKKKVADDLVTERMDALKKFNETFESTLDPKKLKKAEKLEEERVKKIEDIRDKDVEIRTKDLKEIAKLMAEAQVDKQRAEAKYNNTVIHLSDRDRKNEPNDGKNHTYLDDEMREYIKDNANTFGRPLKEGESPDMYGKDEKGNRIPLKFDQKKFQEHMLKLASDHALDNEYAEDATYKADYYASMKDRKDLIDKRDDANYAQIKLKDRRFAKKLFEVAGIEVEKDKTIGKRLGHIGAGALKGAAMGGAIALATEYLSTTKIVESKFAEIVQYAGVIPYKKVINYDKMHNVSLTDEVTLKGKAEGDVDYHTQVTVEGVATGDVSLPYEDMVHYEGGGYLDGTFTGSGSGVAHGSVSVPSYTNGILEGVVEVPVDLPYDYDYSHDYHLPYSYEGDIKVSGIATGQANIPYKQVVDVDGTVHWVADVELTDEVTLNGDVRIQDEIVVEDNIEYSGEEKVEGTTKGRAKINWDNIKGATIIGGITGMLNAAADWKKIWDDGERGYAKLRSVLAEKNVDGKPVQVIKTPVEEDSVPTPPPAIEPPKTQLTPDETTVTEIPAVGDTKCEAGDESCRAEAEKDPKSEDAYKQVFDMKGKLLYDVIAKAYGITDPKELYEAIGIVKGWHGISQAERSKNIWIAQLGLKGSLTLANGKKFDLDPIKDRNKIDDYTATADNGVYRDRLPATVEHVGGKLVVYCPDGGGSGEVKAQYDKYEDAKLAAKYFNEHGVLPTSQELEEMKNPKKKEE